VRLKLAPAEPPYILTALARVLQNPPSELRGFNQLEGIQKFAVALFQNQKKQSEVRRCRLTLSNPS